MAKPACSDEEFIALWKRHKSVTKLAKHLGIAARSVQNRRLRLQTKYSVQLLSDDARSPYRISVPENRVRLQVDMTDGVFVVFSDAHYWPGVVTTAHRALVALLPSIKPNVVIANGDLLDSASNNRHDRICWQQTPTVKQEMETTRDRLAEVQAAARGAKCLWTRGNHDANFETRLANSVPQYEGVAGMSLQDHFPEWLMCMSVMFNDNVIVKHRWHNGIHASYNNTLKSGVSIITGHLHSLKVFPWSDYRGTRYGVDTGTLADTYGPQFTYTEDNPVNWRSGFVVCTIRDGKLLPPEMCEVVDEGHVFFRGQVVEV